MSSKSSRPPKTKNKISLLVDNNEASKYQDHLLDFDSFTRKTPIKYQNSYFDIVKEKQYNYSKSLFTAINKAKDKEGDNFCTLCEFTGGKHQKTTQEAEMSKEFFHEIEIYIRLRPHTGICKFYGYFLIPQKTIVVENFKNGSLLDIYSNLSKGLSTSTSSSSKKRWNNLLKAKIIFGMACAMMHLHANKIYHGNLQPSQIYFDSNWEPQITGYASFYQEHMNVDYKEYDDEDFKKSFLYISPEIILKKFDKKLMKKADVFSFAIISYTVITDGEEGLFELIRDDDFYEKYLSGELRPEFPPDVHPLLKSIITNSWNPDPTKRPLFSQIIKALRGEKNIFPGIDVGKYEIYQENIFTNIDIAPEDVKLLKSPAAPPAKRPPRSNQDTKAKESGRKSLRRAVSSNIKAPKSLDELTSAELNGNDEFSEILKNAQDGQPDAMVAVGTSLHKGTLCDKDDDLAFQFYKRAAENKSLTGMYNCAMCMSTGCGTEKNEAKAMEMMKEATGIKDVNASEEDREGWYTKAIITYAQMLHSQKKDKEADQYFQLAIKAQRDNDGDSFYFYAKYLEEKGDVEKALDNYINADKKGHKLAANDYAVTLLSQGGPGNIKKALDQLRKSSEQNQPVASTNYGKILYYGQYGQRKQIPRAVKLFKQAAKKGYAEACFMFAYALIHGDANATEKDNPKEYFKKAADQGHTIAMVQLAKLLQSEKKDREAAEYLKKGADLEDSMAMFKYANCLENGKGVEKDMDQAMELYRKAAELGNKLAQDKLEEFKE